MPIVKNTVFVATKVLRMDLMLYSYYKNNKSNNNNINVQGNFGDDNTSITLIAVFHGAHEYRSNSLNGTLSKCSFCISTIPN